MFILIHYKYTINQVSVLDAFKESETKLKDVKKGDDFSDEFWYKSEGKPASFRVRGRPYKPKQATSTTST